MNENTQNRSIILYDSFSTTELRDIHHISWWHGDMMAWCLTTFYMIICQITRPLVGFWGFALARPLIRIISLNMAFLTTTVAPQTKKAWRTCLPGTSVLPLARLFTKRLFFFRYNILDLLAIFIPLQVHDKALKLALGGLDLLLGRLVDELVIRRLVLLGDRGLIL